MGNLDYKKPTRSCSPRPVEKILFSKGRFSSFARLGGPWLVALALVAIAPAVRGQVNLMGVLSQRVSTTYYVGLFYDFSGSAPQIISTDVDGVRTVLLASGYWSYQVTPFSISFLTRGGDPDSLTTVSVPDEMFLPLTQLGTPGALPYPYAPGAPPFQYATGGTLWEGATIVWDILGPYSGDKVADQSTMAGFIHANNGGTSGTVVSAGYFETRDTYYGVFDYYYTNAVRSTPTNPDPTWTGSDSNIGFVA